MNRRLGSETVTLLTSTKAAAVDEFGNDVLVHAELDLDGCRLEPRTSGEDNDARAAVITGLWLFAPGNHIGADDAIRHAGQQYEVDGEPGTWVNTSRRWTYQQVALRRVTG